MGVLLAALLFVTSCSLLTGGAVADSCSSLERSAKDNCYFESRQCSRIENTQFRDSCVAELAKTKNDVKVCDLIVTSRTRGFCQEQIALQNDDPEICAGILDEYWQDNCYYHIALDHKDYGLCAYILEMAQNMDCVKKVAMETNNVELCERLSPINKGECVWDIVTETKDVELCARFNNQVNIDACVYKVAKLSENQELCKGIKINEIEQTCNGFFEEKEAAELAS